MTQAASPFKLVYTTTDNVKIRLANKVQFQSNPNTVLNGELPDALLLQYISDAETMVEQQLRKRYAIPFKSKRTGQFVDLPDHSQRALRRIVDLAAVMEVLRSEFGRGEHINGSNYYTDQERTFKAGILELLGMDPEGKIKERVRNSPPLEDVQLAATNKADDGYNGMIINTDIGGPRDPVSYAENQINNPAKSYVGRRGYGGF